MKKKPILKIIWAILCLLLSFLHIHDYFSFLKNPMNYPIGENMHWEYQSQMNFKMSAWALGIWFLVGIILVLCCKNKKVNKILLIHLAITLVYFVHLFYRIIGTFP